MAWGKKKKEEPGKKPIKVTDISKNGKINGKKNLSMWCSMHSCTRAACPGGNH